MKKFRARRKLLSFIIFFFLTIIRKKKLNTLKERRRKNPFIEFLMSSFFSLNIFSVNQTRTEKMVQTRPTRSLILNWDFTHRSAFIFHILVKDAIFSSMRVRESWKILSTIMLLSFSTIQYMITRHPRGAEKNERAFWSSRSILQHFLFFRFLSHCSLSASLNRRMNEF